MKSIPFFTGLLLLAAAPCYAQQGTAGDNQGMSREATAPTDAPSLADSLGPPQQRFRTSELENPRTLQTDVGPLFLVGLPPGLDATEEDAEPDGSDERVRLSNASRLILARQILNDRFPGLKKNVRIEQSDSGILVAGGRVTNLSNKLAVGRALVDVPGGTAVVNAITVQPPRRSDEAIRREVERLLRADPELPNVRVRVNRQVVYFEEGAVPALFVTQAVQRVSRIPGVVDVLVGPLS